MINNKLEGEKENDYCCKIMGFAKVVQNNQKWSQALAILRLEESTTDQNSKPIFADS
jgi:hypothetical protein